MRMKNFVIAILICLPAMAFGQDGITQEGEFGVGLGGAHYFGDLNTRAHLNRPKPAATVFFRKNFGEQ